MSGIAAELLDASDFVRGCRRATKLTRATWIMRDRAPFFKSSRGVIAMLKQKSSEYRGYRTAGIRLSEEQLPKLGELYGARTKPMLPSVHAFDKAHTVMLVEEGLLDVAAGAAILAGLRRLESEGVVAARARVGGGLHSGEQYLIRILGEEIGGRFHLARSSGDLSSVAINTLQREKLLALMRAVNRLRRTLIDLARGHTDTILPGYSFG